MKTAIAMPHSSFSSPILTSSLKQQYAITDVRYDILKIYGLAKVGSWEEIRHIYAARKNIVPIEVRSLTLL